MNSTEAAIDQQTRGQFPAMDRGPSLPLGTLQRSWDKPNPASGQTAPGVVHYLWHPDFIMSVRTRDFMVTTLLLPNWERVNEYYVGDPVVFEAKKVRPNVVAVRSRNAGADSNLTILGASGSVYSFYLRSETWNSTQVTDLTVYIDAPRNADAMDGTGPSAVGGMGEDAPGQTGDNTAPYSAAGMPDYLRRVVFRPEDLRFDMKMYARRESDAEIAPERVFEDGVFTYFDFGDRSDSVSRPVVHQVMDDVDTVVNTRTAGPKGNILIAEAVGDFILRNGNRVVCVRRIGPRPISTAVEIGPIPPEVATAGAAGHGTATTADRDRGR
jgi:type IV secretory pathway VirB9-like protein